MNRIIVIICLILTSLSLAAQQQWVFQSAHLTEPDTVLMYQPVGYQASKKYPLVYLLHGYSQNYEQWSWITDLQQLADYHEAIIVCPDGFTTFFVDSPIDPKSRFEQFFFDELVPKVHSSFNIDNENVFISGLSMGGYGALRLFISRPDYFNTAASSSGSLEIDPVIFGQISQGLWQSDRLVRDTRQIFGYPASIDWHQQDITVLLKNSKMRKPFLLDCGKQDFLLPMTIRLAEAADHLNISITLITQPGDHSPVYWRKAIEYHFTYFRLQKTELETSKNTPK